MSRIVRHRGTGFRSAPLSKHVAYLQRDGVTHDGADARMFDARSDAADERAFAERCRDDRHHFRFIISPEDAATLQSLRTFTRELMADAERDLGTRLDWVAIDHWNTDNPHVHVLIRGRADDGKDLVISRDYNSRGFRHCAAERVTLELGPRSEHEIRSALEKEVEADRWTGLDRALHNIADEGAGIANLRPGAPNEDPELRRLLVGRVAKLERLGLAEQVAPGCWTLKPGIENTLRDLSIRDDIIKTMHRAVARAGRAPDMAGAPDDIPIATTADAAMPTSLVERIRSPPLRARFAIRADGCMLAPHVTLWEIRNEHNADYGGRCLGGGICGFHRVGATADPARCRHY